MPNKYILIPLLLLCISIGCAQESQVPFDTKLWLAERADRYKMIDSILGSQDFISQDTASISVSFGNPDYVSQSLDTIFWTYHAGSKVGAWTLEVSYLKMHFTEGSVTKITSFKNYD